MSKGKAWTKEETAYLKANYKNKTNQEMADTLKTRTAKAVKLRCQILGLIKGKFYWSKTEISDLIENYASTNSKDLAQKHGKTLRGIYQKARQLGLKKSKEWIALNAKENLEKRDHPAKFTQFQKGQTAWNKGMKGLIIPGSEKGFFPKGYRPHNTAKIGDESLIDGYTKVKVGEPNQWEWKHRLVWKENFGEIPEGHAIIFKDGNRTNFAIENLECVSRKELGIRNSIHQKAYSPELRTAIYALSTLRRRINRRRKKNAQK